MATNKTAYKKNKSSQKSVKVSSLMSNGFKFSRTNLVVLALLFAAVGGYFLYRSFAAVPYTKISVNSAVVGVADAQSSTGYWLVGADGGVFTEGTATFYGSMGGKTLSAPVVGIVATSDAKGYWLVGSDGAVYAFGDAQYYGGSPALAGGFGETIVGATRTASGQGYWLVSNIGRIWAYGDARAGGEGEGTLIVPGRAATSAASLGGSRIVGAATNYTNNGVTLVGNNGDTYSYGTQNFGGNGQGGVSIGSTIVGITSSSDGKGYWLVGSDGGVFNFGDAPFYGSMGGQHLNLPVSGISPTATGAGYYLAAQDGGVFAFGDAQFQAQGSVVYTPKCPSGDTGTYPNCLAPTSPTKVTQGCTGSSCTPACTGSSCTPACTGSSCTPACTGSSCPPACTGSSCTPACTSSSCNDGALQGAINGTPVTNGPVVFNYSYNNGPITSAHETVYEATGITELGPNYKAALLNSGIQPSPSGTANWVTCTTTSNIHVVPPVIIYTCTDNKTGKTGATATNT